MLKDEKLVMQFYGPDILWSYPYDDDGVHSQTSDGRILNLLDIGGKGLCDALLPAPEVQFPPFGP